MPRQYRYFYGNLEPRSREDESALETIVDTLCEDISRLRHELAELHALTGSLTDAAVIRVSQQLDRMILAYQSMHFNREA